MNWDWEKLKQQQRQRTGGPATPPPGFDDLADKLKRFKNMKLPGGKILVGLIVVIWLLSGIYIVGPDERGVVLRFGAYDREAGPGPHYHIPYPIESVYTPNITQIRRLEVGFQSSQRGREFKQGAGRAIPDEALMLTGDENIVDVQFIVQYQVASPKDYLFNVVDPDLTVKSAAEAAMREVIGKNAIDEALTTGKLKIQNQTRELMQKILDDYTAGILIVAVQLQNVHPPMEVIDAFKDVVSAREDRSRMINEAEAYRRDILPKAKGNAAVMVNAAQAFSKTEILRAEGDASRFLAVLEEYNKAKDVTQKRLYLETMEKILSNPLTEKLILSDKALQKSVPYLPLGQVQPGQAKRENQATQ